MYIPGSSGGFSSSASRAPSLKKGGMQKAREGRGTPEMHRATLRSYTVLGKTYYPRIVEPGSEFFGISSWYGPKFHGKQTSSGEIYNMYDMTAAHKTLPMHTIVEVTHRESGKKITVRINDRGPFVDGRILDLSYKAGVTLGLHQTGTAPIKLRVLSYDDHVASRLGRGDEGEQYAVQLGSFRSRDGAERFRDTTGKRYGRNATLHAVEQGGEILYRVLLAGFQSEESARSFIQSNGLSGAVVTAAN